MCSCYFDKFLIPLKLIKINKNKNKLSLMIQREVINFKWSYNNEEIEQSLVCLIYNCCIEANYVLVMYLSCNYK